MKNLLMVIFVVMLASVCDAQQKPITMATLESGFLNMRGWGEKPYDGNLLLTQLVLRRQGISCNLLEIVAGHGKLDDKNRPTFYFAGADLGILRENGNTNLIYAERLHWMQLEGENNNAIFFARGNALVFFPEMDQLDGIGITFAYLNSLMSNNLEALELEIVAPEIDFQDKDFINKKLVNWSGDQKKDTKLIEWSVKLESHLTGKTFKPDEAKISTIRLVKGDDMVVVPQEGKILVLGANDKVKREVIVEHERPWMIRYKMILKSDSETKGTIQRKAADKDACR